MTDAESAMQFIDAHDRVTWLEIGMAMKSEYGDTAFPIWDNWSRTADNYCPQAAKSVWRSFKQSGAITIKTLFHHARKSGWQPDKTYIQPSPEERAERARIAQKRFSESERELHRNQAKAAVKAREIFALCYQDTHAYLDAKGMPDLKWSVYRKEGCNPLLVVPFIFEKRISSLQFISISGEKKNLKGGRTSEATFELSNSGRQVWLCEGLATGLALQKILEACRLKYTIRICFTAGNMLKVSHHDDFMVADNDVSLTGLKVAEQSGCKFYMPENVGDDINDELKKYRLLEMTMKIREWLNDGSKTKT